MRIRQVLFFILSLLFFNLNAQDIHFSQFSASPLLVNPALTGFFNDQLRVGLNFRSQGETISVPYKTCAAAIDGVVQPLYLHDNWFGIGCVAYNDNAGDGSLQKTSVMLTAAFHKGLNRYGNLKGSVGFAIGLVNRSVNYSKLVFGNQWNGIQFDPNLSNNENYSAGSFIYLDIATGILVSCKINPASVVSGGISLYHVNKPAESFYEGSERLGWKWNLHANANLKLVDEWFLESGILCSYMNAVTEVTVGGNLSFGKKEVRVCVGLWYRLQRDLIPVAGLDFDRYRILFSYDVTVSGLSKASYMQGGFELSLQKTFTLSRKKHSCEDFRFL